MLLCVIIGQFFKHEANIMINRFFNNKNNYYHNHTWRLIGKTATKLVEEGLNACYQMLSNAAENNSWLSGLRTIIIAFGKAANIIRMTLELLRIIYNEPRIIPDVIERLKNTNAYMDLMELIELMQQPRLPMELIELMGSVNNFV